MRCFLLLVVFICISEPVAAQQRYLVAPNSEVIPLSPRESSAEVIKSRSTQPNSSTGTCPDKFTFGYPPSIYPVTSNFGSYHRDILGQWFVAPASGTIDTIFWFNRALIGAYDSTIFLRVHRSNIGPEYGPGIRPGPFNPPCQNWGYWKNTNDFDQGIGAFIEDATDTSWISTINGSSAPSSPPFRQEMWGLGGYAVRIRPNSVGFAAMSDLALPLAVTTGDKFFISMRIAHENNAQGGHKERDTEEARTEWNASGFTVGPSDPDYPSHNWKFYEHDKGPSDCAGFPLDSIKRGWVARGAIGVNDTLSVAAYNIWYVMSVISNVPPIFVGEAQTILHNTFSTGPRPICMEITDCSIPPESAGVVSTVIVYSVNGMLQPEISMVNSGPNIWCGDIPAQPAGSLVSYKIKSTDKNGAVSQSRITEYRVLSFGNEWYALDTSSTCVKQDIRTTGTTISLASFFGPPNAPQSYNPMDEGTAGPFDMGGNFIVFGDTFRYAWVGVNGAIALSKSPSDTIDVNSNGYYSYKWDFPYPTYSGRDNSRFEMPPMFIAPLWTDLSLADSTGSWGSMVYGNNNNVCKFIVEWDGVEDFEHCQFCYNTFRVVLDRCDGTIEFQYDEIYSISDNNFLVGMQYDTSSVKYPNPYVYINKQGYPSESKPRFGWCNTMTPVTSSVNNKDHPLPKEFALSQNYPNPFNPVTHFQVDVAKTSQVEVFVYDILGRKIATLLNAERTAGSYTMEWNGKDGQGLTVPTGMYFIRMKAGEFTQSQKVSLLK